MKNPTSRLPKWKIVFLLHRKKALGGATALLFLIGILSWRYFIKTPDSITLFGNVDIREVNLGFRVPGRIADTLKDEGDSVQPNEVIARLDAEPYQDVVAEMKANVAVNQATLSNAEILLKRNQDLLPSHSTSQQDVDNALAIRDQARANLQFAQAKLASAQVDLDDATIHAPASGTIITRAQEPGAIVAAGTTVLTLSLDKPVWVRAYISENQLGRIYPERSRTPCQAGRVDDRKTGGGNASQRHGRRGGRFPRQTREHGGFAR